MLRKDNFLGIFKTFNKENIYNCVKEAWQYAGASLTKSSFFSYRALQKKCTTQFPQVLLYLSGNMKATKMAVIVEVVVGVVTKGIFIITFLFQVTFDKMLFN